MVVHVVAEPQSVRSVACCPNAHQTNGECVESCRNHACTTLEASPANLADVVETKSLTQLLGPPRWNQLRVYSWRWLGP